MKSVYKTETLEQQAYQSLEKALASVPGTWISTRLGRPRLDGRFEIQIKSSRGKSYRFAVTTRSRLNPQVALSLEKVFHARSKNVLPVIFAPVISPRVGDILRGNGIGYVDAAGNCWLHSDQQGLLIQRSGFAHPARQKSTSVDLFATKTSRIVRTMLQTPLAGWKMRDLASISRVSLGLVVKAKPSLIQQGYALENNRRLYLCDPVGLLNAWAKRYHNRVNSMPLYLRGELHEIENTICEWCWDMSKDKQVDYSLCSFSAAWRLAPQVRYTVGSMYFDAGLQTDEAIIHLIKYLKAKSVESGANFIIWIPHLDSATDVQTQDGSSKIRITAPLQTYLDLSDLNGRGEEAAQAIFDKYLKKDMEAAAQRAQEWQRGNT